MSFERSSRLSAEYEHSSVPQPRRVGFVRPAVVLAHAVASGVGGAPSAQPLSALGAAAASGRPSRSALGPGARAAVAGLLPPGARCTRQPGTALRRSLDVRPPLLRPRIRDAHAAAAAALPMPLPLVLLRDLRHVREQGAAPLMPLRRLPHGPRAKGKTVLPLRFKLISCGIPKPALLCFQRTNTF